MSSNSGFEQSSYAGQVVVVTGAASGIGKSAAQLIASRGATVICVPHQPARWLGRLHGGAHRGVLVLGLLA